MYLFTKSSLSIGGTLIVTRTAHFEIQPNLLGKERERGREREREREIGSVNRTAQPANSIIDLSCLSIGIEWKGVREQEERKWKKEEIVAEFNSPAWRYESNVE